MSVTSLSVEFRLTDVLSRWILVVGAVTVLGLAGFYSRQNREVAAGLDHKGLKFSQKEFRGWEERGWFTPDMQSHGKAAGAEDKNKTLETEQKEIPPAEQNNKKQEERKLATPLGVPFGYYYEELRLKGDAYADGETALVKRRCVPVFNWPIQCNLPDKDRINHPLVREDSELADETK